MSKKEAEKQEKTPKVPMAAWKHYLIMCTVVVIFGIGVIVGWNWRSADMARVQAEANNLASQMLKSEASK